MRWATRQIEAPAADTLSAAEVAVMIGYSDPKSVMRLVDEGRLPEPIEEEGGRRWLWEDVVWFLMSKRIRPRLKKPPPADPAPARRGQSRTMSDTAGHSRDSAGTDETAG